MRLRPDKTWSQQELAAKLRVGAPVGNSLISWEHRRLVIHAGKTALAAALCWWLALRFGLHDGYWGSISAIIVLQSNFGATISASRDRILGTLIGAILGMSFSYFGGLLWSYIAALFVAVVICGLLGFRSSSRLAGVTITIVMLVRSSSHQSVAIDRVVEVFLGIVVALAVATFVFPDRARLALKDGLAQEFLVLGSFFEGILQGFRGSPAENVTTLRENLLALLRSNGQLLAAARNEPSGGPGWREGLGMLEQFGRSLFDSLVALEIAVKDSSEDNFAQHLEPEFGQLANDIHTGFQYVANCTHLWRFHVPPPSLHLEKDIAALEVRMSGVRHKGIAFSQAEILRAYAVQLHLKQIARLLRASRVETSRTVGEAQGQTEE